MLHSVKIEFDGGNDAMRDRDDIVTELRELATLIELGADSSIIRDINGNTIGDLTIRWD